MSPATSAARVEMASRRRNARSLRSLLRLTATVTAAPDSSFSLSFLKSCSNSPADW